MYNVINALKNDEQLQTFVGANIYPVYTEYLGDCIVYSFHTYMSDSVSERIRLQLTVIAGTMKKTLDIERRVKDILLTLGDEQFSNDFLQIALNGGGTLYDSQREKHHRIMYFELLKRY